MTDVVMPQMGESIVEGTLTRGSRRSAIRVQRDEPLFEISTDKVDTEIPAPAEGVLTEILVQEGAVVAINTVVARIAASAEAASAAKGADTSGNAGADLSAVAGTAKTEPAAAPAVAAKPAPATASAPAVPGAARGRSRSRAGLRPPLPAPAAETAAPNPSPKNPPARSARWCASSPGKTTST